MTQAALRLTKPPRRRPDLVEAYEAEAPTDSTAAADDSTRTKILRETEPKAPFPSTEPIFDIRPILRTGFATGLNAVNAIASSIRSTADAIASSGSGDRDLSQTGGPRLDDYRVR